MFGKKYDPEKIVGQLATILVPSCAAHVTGYINAVQLDKAERKRMTLSMYLFSISASHGLVGTRNEKFKTTLLKAHRIYLERFRDAETLVKLGELIIWPIERESVSRELHDQSGKSIVSSDFDFHEIRYETLLHVISGIRSNAFLTDISMGMFQGQDDIELGMSLAFKNLGISFTRYVLEIEPNDPELASADRIRFQSSAAHASILLGQGFYNVTDMLKSMSA